MASMQSSAGGSERDRRLQDVIEQIIRRRMAGELFSDDAILAAHGELMPELQDRLAALQRVNIAESLAAGDTISLGTDSAIIDRIGPFRILATLGEGGFGIVYLAEQMTPVHRQVALKVIKPGMDSRGVLARFEAERQALAMMDHPHVAKVFDAGMTPDGRPYFAMEYVAGVPLTEHCNRHRLGVRERLELLIKVCDAVQHAHQKGIIHRDLKPSNVLVEVKGQDAAPKVIDFGVAKAMDQPLSDMTVFTELGQLIGTPAYMSPEQAERTAQDIDTRSDIYSLGVILYELLTGALPLDNKSLRAAARAQIPRIIREFEPPKPSMRLHLLATAAPAGGHDSTDDQTELRSRSRRVRGDLDWITMKALEKDRTRRYASASDLAADLRRHLDDEPVSAGPPTASYRVRKFARRHRGFAIAATAVFLALLAGVVGTTLGLRKAQRAQALAEAHAREAQSQTQNATAIRDFLINDMLNSVNPKISKGRAITVSEVLTNAAGKVDEAFSAQPQLRGYMHHTLGVVFLRLGRYYEAQQHLEQAVRLRRAELGNDDRATLSTQHWLAHLLWRQGAYKDAEKLARATYEAQRRALGPDDPDTLLSGVNLGITLYLLGQLDEAETQLRDAVARRKRVSGLKDRDTLLAMSNLGMCLHALRKFDEAQQILEETSENQRALGEDHPDFDTIQHNLGMVLMARRDWGKAEQLYRDSLARSARMLGPNHPDTLETLNNLAAAVLAGGKPAEAEQLFAELVRQRRLIDESNPESVKAMDNWALVLRKLGRQDTAEVVYRDLLAIRRRSGDPLDERLLQTQGHLVECLLAQDRIDDARPAVVELIALRRQRAERAEASADDWNEYAWLLLNSLPSDTRDPATALTAAQRAEQLSGGRDGHILTTLAESYAARNEWNLAIAAQQRALQLLGADDESIRAEYTQNLERFSAERARSKSPDPKSDVGEGPEQGNSN